MADGTIIVSEADDASAATGATSPLAMTVSGDYVIGGWDAYYWEYWNTWLQGGVRLGDVKGNMVTGTPYTATTLSGSVTVAGVAAARTVRIHDRVTGLPVRTLTSGADGSYAVTGLDDVSRYYVVALPEITDQANAVIIDRVQVA